MNTVRPAPKGGQMAKAAKPVKTSSGRTHEPSVGNETKADMKGAMEGSPTDANPLRGAIQELGAQHPHAYHDHGPHHGTSEHRRHARAVNPNPSHPYGR
jgi:hypothetical protein